jgi:hypothetical protein
MPIPDKEKLFASTGVLGWDQVQQLIGKRFCFPFNLATSCPDLMNREQVSVAPVAQPLSPIPSKHRYQFRRLSLTAAKARKGGGRGQAILPKRPARRMRLDDFVPEGIHKHSPGVRRFLTRG